MPVIVPQIDVKPTDFLAAREAGDRARLEERGQDISAGEHAASLAQAAAEAGQRLQLAQQQLQAKQLQAKQQADARKQQLDQQYQLQQARESVAASYHQQQLELEKTRIQNEAQMAAKRASDTHMFQIGIEGGMNPKDLAMKFPYALQASRVSRAEPKPPSTPKIDDFTKVKAQMYGDVYKSAIEKANASTDATVRKQFLDQAADAQSKIDKLQESFKTPATDASQPAAQPASAAASGGMEAAATALSQPQGNGTVATPMGTSSINPNPPIGGAAPMGTSGMNPNPKPGGTTPMGTNNAQPAVQSLLPQVGAVVNGYRYKGGDHTSQDSWEPVQNQGGDSPAPAPDAGSPADEQ